MMKFAKRIRLNIQKNILLFTILLSLNYSCEEESYTVNSIQVPIINLQDPYRNLPNYKFTASTKTLMDIYENYGVQNPEFYIKYPVSYHRIVYTTTYKGQQIKASGAIVIPICPTIKAAIVSFQHGTMFADRDAPSNSNSVENFPFFNEYILFLPDYIGYGESKGILHPYFIHETITSTVIDMIKAGKRYLDDNHINYNPDKLFLTGHSEGGYVTIAVQKELEENPIEGLNLVASAPSAGPYDVELIGKLIFQNNSYPSPAYLIFILSAYSNYYWQRPITDFFQQPYAANIMNLLNGIYNENEINQRLTTNLNLLVNPTFLNNYRSDGENELKNMFELNSVYNWAPKTPTRIYHGTADNIVPFEISQKAYDSFILNGSNPKDVKLVPLQGVGHDYVPAYQLILEWFKTFK